MVYLPYHSRNEKTTTYSINFFRHIPYIEYGTETQRFVKFEIFLFNTFAPINSRKLVQRLFIYFFQRLPFLTNFASPITPNYFLKKPIFDTMNISSKGGVW